MAGGEGQGVEVGAPVRRRVRGARGPCGHLRRQEAGVLGRHAAHRRRAPGPEDRGAQPQHLHLLAGRGGGHEQVVRRDVVVGRPLGGQHLQRAQGLPHDLQDAGRRQSGEQVEALPLQQLEHEEGAAVRGEAGVEDGRQVGVPQPCEERRQPLEVRSGGGEPGRGPHRDQLGRDRLARAGVGGLEYGPETGRPEDLQELIAIRELAELHCVPLPPADLHPALDGVSIEETQLKSDRGGAET